MYDALLARMMRPFFCAITTIFVIVIVINIMEYFHHEKSHHCGVLSVIQPARLER